MPIPDLENVRRMDVHWAITNETNGAIRWEWDELVVRAAFDDDGWDVEYGQAEPERLFSTTGSYDDAVADAETCMRLLSMEYAGIQTE